MKTITQAQIVNLLLSERSARPVSFVAVVDARLKKTGNPFPNVRKVSRVNGIVNFDYELAMSNANLKNGDESPIFEAQGRKWGTRVLVDGKPSAIVEHKGNHYFTVKVQRTKKPIYIKEDGKFIAKSAIEKFIPEKPEAPIIYREYGIGSLRSIRFNGETFKVV